jgi:eukaryotic-like serine/threonine-protein kinase
LNSTTGELKWRTTLPGGVSTSPQVDGNLVYIAVSRMGLDKNSYIIAIDATTGTIKWSAPILTEYILCNPTVAEGRVVTASFYGGLRCYDAATGDLLWTFPMGIIRDNAAVVNGTLYLGSEIYRLIAIDMATGVKKWALPSYFDNNNHLIHGIGSSPTVHNGVLYTGGPLGAYDTETGSLKWEYALSSGVLRPVCENETIFGTSPGDIVFAINSSGSLKWKYGNVNSIQPAVEIANATVAHSVVFTGCGMNNKLIALNAANGQLIWTYIGTQPFISGPCVVDGKNNAFHSNASGAQQ